MGDKYQGNGYYNPDPKPQKTSLKDIFVVVGLVLLVLFALNMFKPNDKASDIEETTVVTSEFKNTDVKTVVPSETTEVTTITKPAPTFKYDVKYISHKVDYDKNGNPVLLITYEFTNNSDENASWIVKLHNKVFQTGIECGGIAFHDEITSQMQMNEIQPGTTVTIVEGYPLYDDTSTVTLECKEFLSDKPMFVMELELVE